MGKFDVRLSIWTQLSSFTTISNPGASNHYASSGYEPNWLKSIGKFSFQKVIFGEVYLGVGTHKPCKKLSFKYLLISKNTGSLVQVVKKIDFGGTILVPEGRWYPQTTSKFFLLNIHWYQKTLAPYVKLFKKVVFGVAVWGGPREGGTPKLCQGIYFFIVSWYQRCSTLALAVKNTDICLGPFRGFGGLVPSNYIKIVLFKKFLRTTKKSSALAYGAKKVLFGASSQRMKPDTFWSFLVSNKK